MLKLPKLAGPRAPKPKDAPGRPERRRKSRPAVEGFWDKPSLMNTVADTLLLFGGLGLGYALVLALVRLPVFPLHRVVVATPLDQVTRTQVEYAVQHALRGNFFTVNLDQVRTSFEKLPWVRRASVRRRWPDGLDIELEEHVAVARWQNNAGEARLVNRQGEVFAAARAGSQDALPLLGGPEGSAPRVLAEYLTASQIVMPLGRKLQAVLLSPREAWQIRLDDGLLLELGRDQNTQNVHALDERLQRFAGTYDTVRTRVPAKISAIDMRYPNGFTLRLASGETGRKHENRNTARSTVKGNT